jgi:hypothetical protein
MADDAIDIDLNWNMSGIFDGIGSSLSSAGASTWDSAKQLTDEGAGALFGVIMILVAGMVVWRVSR